MPFIQAEFPVCFQPWNSGILDIGFPLCGKPRVLSTLLPMLLTRLHHPGSPLAVGGGCGKYGLSYCHHKAFMNFRNHLHVFFWGETLKLKQKYSYSVPKNVLRIQEMFKMFIHGFMSWILSWEMPISDLFEIQEGKSFEKFQIMEPKQRKNRTLHHFKSKPLTVTPPSKQKKKWNLIKGLSGKNSMLQGFLQSQLFSFFMFGLQHGDLLSLVQVATNTTPPSIRRVEISPNVDGGKDPMILEILGQLPTQPKKHSKDIIP